MQKGAPSPTRDRLVPAGRGRRRWQVSWLCGPKSPLAFPDAEASSGMMSKGTVR